MVSEKIKAWSCICNKCGHKWMSRTKEKPLQCPKCKTARWDMKK